MGGNDTVYIYTVLICMYYRWCKLFSRATRTHAQGCHEHAKNFFLRVFLSSSNEVWSPENCVCSFCNIVLYIVIIRLLGVVQLYFLELVVFSFLEIVKLLGALFCGRDSESLFLVVVKVGCVAGTLALRDERGFNLKYRILIFFWSSGFFSKQHK